MTTTVHRTEIRARFQVWKLVQGVTPRRLDSPGFRFVLSRMTSQANLMPYVHMLLDGRSEGLVGVNEIIEF